jgi:hypothetical protein
MYNTLSSALVMFWMPVVGNGGLHSSKSCSRPNKGRSLNGARGVQGFKPKSTKNALYKTGRIG